MDRDSEVSVMSSFLLLSVRLIRLRSDSELVERRSLSLVSETRMEINPMDAAMAVMAGPANATMRTIAAINFGPNFCKVTFIGSSFRLIIGKIGYDVF
jgi:hypothetical protein